PQPLAYVAAEQRDGNATEGCRIEGESPQRTLQQQNGSQSIVALQVSKRRRHLYQPLQECLLGFWRREPHAFPCLMSGEEFARFVEPQAFRKRSLAPIEFHDPATQFKLA